MGGHADRVQLRHQIFADAVVEHALAVEHRLFGGVEGGGVVLEILDQGARLRPLIEDFGLAFVDHPAAFHENVPSTAQTQDGASRRRANLAKRAAPRQRFERLRQPSVARAASLALIVAAGVSHMAISAFSFKGLGMSGGFEDRKKAFENKWAHDEELRFKVMARRDKLAGPVGGRRNGAFGRAAADATPRRS